MSESQVKVRPLPDEELRKRLAIIRRLRNPKRRGKWPKLYPAY